MDSNLWTAPRNLLEGLIYNELIGMKALWFHTFGYHKVSMKLIARFSHESKRDDALLLALCRTSLSATTPTTCVEVTLLRDHKNVERDYEPRVVSLGPIQYGKSRYQLAEKYKLRLEDDFIAKSGKGVGELYEIVEKNITQLKGCFNEEVIEMYDDEDLTWLTMAAHP
uniref:Uncharacterized protein n=1 Tax=Fagus sylvatica TaxID=28930 RepID=A0A2N9GH91_FAGSY